MAAASGPGRAKEEQEETESYGSAEEENLTAAELMRLNPFNREAMPNFSSKRWRYMALFDTEHWAQHFVGKTFPTVATALSIPEAQAILRTMQECVLGHTGKRTAEEKRGDEEALRSLKQKLVGLMSDLKQEAQTKGNPAYEAWDRTSFFVRLGPRSPKDAPMNTSQPYGISKEKLKKMMDVVAADLGGKPGRTPHEVLHRFQTVAGRLLKVSTPEEALDLLLTSHRVLQDIAHSLDHVKSGFDVSLVVRTWENSVALEHEVRAFLVGGKVAAISQYDDQMRHPVVEENRQQIVLAVLSAAQDIATSLQSAGFLEDAVGGQPLPVVADFLVLPTAHGGESTWKAKLIELNPFGPMTGAALFTWTHDRRVLQAGQDLYGDLAELEAGCPPSTRSDLPPCVAEDVIEGVPFRYMSGNPEQFSWEHLEVLWEDYMRCAPASLVCRT